MTYAKLIFVLAALLTVSSCSSVRKTLTQTKAAPDEFAVYTRAPLTIPRDYGLRPPTGSGQETASAARNSQDAARRVLLQNSATQKIQIQAATPGTRALLARAGVQNAEADIRQLVNNETTSYAEADKSLMEKMMFWSKSTPGTVVDPKQETKRIQENQALGQPVNQGSTKMISPKPKAPLDGIFDGWFK